MKTTKRHGDSYKCTNAKCNNIGIPNPRFKLSILAGDDTNVAEFILFGRQAQRLTRKSADTLVAENPTDFIPDEITRLLEKTFTWIVSFTDSTTDSGTITLQVNTWLEKSVKEALSFQPCQPHPKYPHSCCQKVPPPACMALLTRALLTRTRLFLSHHLLRALLIV